MSKHAQVAREVKIDCFVFLPLSRIQGIALHLYFLGLLVFLHLRSFDQPQILLPKKSFGFCASVNNEEKETSEGKTMFGPSNLCWWNILIADVSDFCWWVICVTKRNCKTKWMGLRLWHSISMVTVTPYNWLSNYQIINKERDINWTHVILSKRGETLVLGIKFLCYRFQFHLSMESQPIRAPLKMYLPTFFVLYHSSKRTSMIDIFINSFNSLSWCYKVLLAKAHWDPVKLFYSKCSLSFAN